LARLFLFSLRGGFSWFGTPRRESAPAWRVTFFAGAKKVTKETPNTSLFERWWPCHLIPLQRVVRSVATSIHGDVNDLFFPHLSPFATVIPAKAGIQAVLANDALDATPYIPWIPAYAGMTKRRVQTRHELVRRRDQPKTSPEGQWQLTESSPHVCAPAASHLSPNRRVLGVSLVTFFAPAKKVTRHAGADSRRGAKRTTKASASTPLKATR